MSEIIKKIFGILNAMPAFTNLFKKAATTGKVDPIETLSALSSISADTKKCADVAMSTAQNGGSIADIAKAMTNIGKINVLGQELDTRTLPHDLKKAGGICSVLANMLEKMQEQSPEEIIAFGNAASNVKNWQDFVKQ